MHRAEPGAVCDSRVAGGGDLLPRAMPLDRGHGRCLDGRRLICANSGGRWIHVHTRRVIFHVFVFGFATIFGQLSEAHVWFLDFTKRRGVERRGVWV